MVIERVPEMSVEEFLDFAESSEDRYEYIDGEPHKMTGGKLNHFQIIANIMFQFRLLLAETDCRTLPNGMLVSVGEASLVSPDVIVVCGEPETEADTRILLNPILVVEVTSPSSMERDRVVKREYYGDVPSIQAYLVVDQERAVVELYRRGDTGWYIQRFSNLDDHVPLEALGIRLPLRDIYQRIELEEEPPSSAGDS